MKIEVEAQLIDDLVRTVGIIALSSRVGRGETEYEYTAKMYEHCTERCQKTMQKHNLYEWRATTKQVIGE